MSKCGGCQKRQQEQQRALIQRQRTVVSNQQSQPNVQQSQSQINELQPASPKFQQIPNILPPLKR